MAGHPGSGLVRLAHADSRAGVALPGSVGREDREAAHAERLSPSATREQGAGHRELPEEPDP